jgi:hypothetical protein
MDNPVGVFSIGFNNFNGGFSFGHSGMPRSSSSNLHPQLPLITYRLIFQVLVGLFLIGWASDLTL